MSKQADPSDTTKDTALRWFVRIHSGDATVQEQAAFERWLIEDPRHAEHYSRLSDLWCDLDRLPQITASAQTRRRRERWVLPAIATLSLAAMLVIAVVGQDFLILRFSDYRSKTGELRTVTLVDGTRVQLDAESALTVHYTPERRSVRLLAGRAYFEVTHDSNRPFDVASAEGHTIAVGTAFEVAVSPGTTTVSVTEGIVELQHLGQGPERATSLPRLNAGHRMHFSTSSYDQAESVDPAQVGAWRRGRMIFDNASLDTVINELNRYRNGRVVLWDAALGSARINGIFNLKDPEGVLVAIEGSLPVAHLSLPLGLIVLYHRS